MMEPLNSSWQLLSNTSLESYREGDNVQAGYGESSPATILYLMADIINTYFIGSLSLVGVVTNLINLVVFYRQGILTESSTTTLSALAVSDFWICFLNLWCCLMRMVQTYWDQSKNSTRWDVVYFYYLTGVRPRHMFTQITCWCTAYLALERFCSVVFPFKVKAVFSTKRSCVILTSIFLGTICLYIPNSFTDLPVLLHFNNITYLTYRPSHLFPKWVMTTSIQLNPILLRTLSMVVVVFCNVAIFWKVTLSQKFRKYATSTSQGISPGSASEQTPSTSRRHDATETTDRKTAGKQKDHKTTKEMTLLRMLMVICSLFIFCYTPDTVLVILFYTNPNFTPPRAIEDFLYGIITILEVINSCSNVFIYYNMSTRFRRDLRSLLCNAK